MEKKKFQHVVPQPNPSIYHQQGCYELFKTVCRKDNFFKYFFHFVFLSLILMFIFPFSKARHEHSAPGGPGVGWVKPTGVLNTTTTTTPSRKNARHTRGKGEFLTRNERRIPLKELFHHVLVLPS